MELSIGQYLVTTDQEKIMAVTLRMFNELAANSKNKNIRDPYKGINELRCATNREIT
jgi:hypothetical protein